MICKTSLRGVKKGLVRLVSEEIFIFKPSLREVKNWVCETSLRGVKNGSLRLVSEEVEIGQELYFQT